MHNDKLRKKIQEKCCGKWKIYSDAVVFLNEYDDEVGRVDIDELADVYMGFGPDDFREFEYVEKGF